VGFVTVMSRDYAGRGGDQDARHRDMCASRVASYHSGADAGHRCLHGHAASTCGEPLYRGDSTTRRLRRSHAAMRDGAPLVRADAERARAVRGLKIGPGRCSEMLIAFNTSNRPSTHSDHRRQLRQISPPFVGSCESKNPAPERAGEYHVEVPPLDYIVCAAGVGPWSATRREWCERGEHLSDLPAQASFAE